MEGDGPSLRSVGQVVQYMARRRAFGNARKIRRVGVVLDRAGVWRTRVVQRKPIDERWEANVADEMAHYPWIGADREPRDEAEDTIGLKMKDDELDQEARNEVLEVVPGNFYIEAKDLR